MKKKLYIVRHGQTEYNRDGKVQGWCDSPLTQLGHKQAAAAREYFEQNGIHFDYAACSTLGRTEQTLKDITDLPYERKDGLKEFSYGDFEGKPIESVKKTPINLDTYYKEHGGESAKEVTQRMSQTLHEIMDRDDVHNALVVSHGSSSYRFAHSIDPKKAKAQRKFSNCQIYEYDYDDRDHTFHLVGIRDDHVKNLQDK